MLETPVLLIIFNRPQHTRRVLEVLRQVQPRQLFVAADGPRAERPEDEEKCRQTRLLIDGLVNWECEIHKNYSEDNLGAAPRPATGITWFFENVEQGIILEDDCVPHPTFFRFCEEILNYYKANDRVMHVSGNNFQDGRKRDQSSYYFSIYPICWGWATWRRAWQKVDWQRVTTAPEHFVNTFEWDFTWWKTMKWNNGLAVVPNVNLVSNIGHGEDATHTKEEDHLMNVPAQPMEFPLVHPTSLRTDSQSDRYTYYAYFRHGKTPLHRTYMQIGDVMSESIQRAYSVLQRIGNVTR